MGAVQTSEELQQTVVSSMAAEEGGGGKGPSAIFDTFPPELLSKIFACLDADFLCKCSAVCKRWNVLANNDVLWKSLCQHRFTSLRHVTLDLHPRVNYSDPRLVLTLSIKEIKSVLARRYVRVPTRGAVEKDELVALLKTTRPIHSPRGLWSGKWKSTYIVAELDLARTALTYQEVSTMDWQFEFTDSAMWQLQNPTALHNQPRNVIAHFRPDGTYDNPVMIANGYRWHLTPEGGVQVETSPPHRASRTLDGGWMHLL
ncbi:hypothetical protein HDU87_002195 [Geranomyces variabilis]|uniref:F-box domain-containing protein n=1 Tax=Geranomyces variabilis TaxID=109894 RepID=A0AAD5TM88_9FUNG|nr:hypothetical protein HDU87_002195 [Geranomyces variabilis]